MHIKNIEKLAQEGESETVELKKSTAQLRPACETICAFLNCDGGVVLIGVTDSGKLVGQEVADRTKRELGNELSKITPTSDIEVNYIHINDKTIIAIHVTTDSSKRPYMYDNKAYIRRQTNTIPMPRDYLEQLILANADGKFAWDNQVATNVTLSDLDTDEIISTIKEGSANGRIPENHLTDDPILILQRLDLIDKGNIKNAAVILFGKNPEKFYPQCMLRLARFRGTDKKEFIDNRQVTGNIFKQLSEAMAFANSYLPIASTFSPEQIKRIDTPLFPIFALREALANALCHRNYSHYSGSVSFAIFDDRLEIWNHGSFPDGVTLSNLKTLNCSFPRNRKIANVLYYHKIFESWGRGVRMIIDECIQAGHPEPTYAQDGLGTLLTLPSKQPIGPTRVVHSDKQTVLFKSLNKRQQEILRLLSQHEVMPPSEILAALAETTSERTLRRDLSHLQEKGFVYSEGKGPSVVWRLINPAIIRP